MKKSLVLGLALLAGGTAQAAVIDFEEFVIRDGAQPGTPSITENVAGDGFVTSVLDVGDKVGYGTSAFNGFQLNDLETVTWNQVDGHPSIVPYLNIWVTDGTNYAVIASENYYQIDPDLTTRNEWKIFEFGPTLGAPLHPDNYNYDWLFDSGVGGRSSQYLTRNGQNVTLADFSDNILVYSGPGIGAPGVGTGAPQGGYGFNLIWGDTAANFAGDFYSLNQLEVSWGVNQYEAGNAVVPIPAAAPLGLLGMGLIGLARKLRKKSS